MIRIILFLILAIQVSAIDYKWTSVNDAIISTSTTWSSSKVSTYTTYPASMWAVKTTTYTAAAGDWIITNAAGGAFDIIFSATPTQGDTIRVLESGLGGTKRPTIEPSGNAINAVSERITISETGFFGFTWVGGVQGWVILQ